ncbi:MAG: hypothetical protein JW388_1277 [Nitrospira sp.]|nr:hypothetical protein [Nitrospira sp.]
MPAPSHCQPRAPSSRVKSASNFKLALFSATRRARSSAKASGVTGDATDFFQKPTSDSGKVVVALVSGWMARIFSAIFFFVPNQRLAVSLAMASLMRRISSIVARLGSAVSTVRTFQRVLIITPVKA